MASLSKYKEYKESEFVGIGAVPKHWQIKRLKHLGEAIIGLTYSPNDVIENEEGILVLRSSNIQEGVIAFDDCVYVNKEVSPNLITQKGDILICARNGSAHLVGKNICIDEKSAGHTFGAFMVVFRGKYWRYFSYFFNSPIFTSQTGMFSTTTINQLTSQTLNNLRIAFPSDKTEQENICNYLDDQTQKIDRLIANKKAQAEKLKELRQIEINNAVTKGLNSKAEMKDSGIEWLGKIPRHWDINRLKNVTHVNQDVIAEKTPPDYEIKYIDIGNVTSTGEFLELQEMTFSEAPSRARRKVKHN
ncbi:MAG: restriction endonuclease subunit S, partial [bacterium]